MYADWALEIALSASLQVVADAEDAKNKDEQIFTTNSAAINLIFIPKMLKNRMSDVNDLEGNSVINPRISIQWKIGTFLKKSNAKPLKLHKQGNSELK
jgi:hypothetical protein